MHRSFFEERGLLAQHLLGRKLTRGDQAIQNWLSMTFTSKAINLLAVQYSRIAIRVIVKMATYLRGSIDICILFQIAFDQL